MLVRLNAWMLVSHHPKRPQLVRLRPSCVSPDGTAEDTPSSAQAHAPKRRTLKNRPVIPIRFIGSSPYSPWDTASPQVLRHISIS